MSDTAIATLVSGLVTVATMVIGFLTLWVKLRYGTEKAEKAAKEVVEKTQAVADKIDENTDITKAGVANAVNTAKLAAANAAHTKVVVENAAVNIDRKLNGGLDAALAQAVDPIYKVLDEHRAKIDELNTYVHQRNHEMLNSLQIQTYKIEAMIALLRSKFDVDERPTTDSTKKK